MASAVLWRSQMARLFQILHALQSGRHPNARELAESCDVSRRTIYRDLETLMLAGLPIEFRHELRGYRLAPGYSVKPSRLDLSALQALLVLVESWSGHEHLGLLPSARSALDVLVEQLAPEVRDDMDRLRKRVGGHARRHSRSSCRAAIGDTVLAALRKGTNLRLTLGPQDETVNAQPQRIGFRDSRWILHFTCAETGALRSIPVCEILAASDLDESRAELGPSQPPKEDRSDRGGRFRIRIRLLTTSPEEFRLRMPWPVRLEPTTLDRSDQTVACFEMDCLEEAAIGLLSYAETIEILEPTELRACLRNMGERIARRHAGEQATVRGNPDSGAVAG